MESAKNQIKLIPIGTTALVKECAPLLMEAYNTEPWNDQWTFDRAFDRVNYGFLSPNFFGLAAMRNHEVIACLFGNFEPNDKGDFFYLRDMMVADQERRTGLGSMLLDSLKKHLETIGVKSVLMITNNSHHTVPFYKKNGFSFLEEMKVMYIDE